VATAASPAPSVYHQDGVFLTAGNFALANGLNDDPDADASTLSLLIDGTWLSFDIETDNIATLAVTSQALYAVGRNGLFLRVDLPVPSDWQAAADRTTMSVIRDAHKFGELTRCRAVGDAAFVVGQCGQVYRLVGNRVDEYSFRLRSDEGPDFEDIGGLSDSLLYACGVGGAVYRFDGQRWRAMDVPTDVNLSGVVVESERSIYFCGDGGTLLHLLDDKWVVYEGDPERNYWDICLYRGAPVLAHSSGLDRFADGSFEPLDPSPDPENTFYRLHSLGDRLLSTGPDDVFVIDGNGVRPIDVPGRP
jgi:hypothetical protein